VFFSSETHNGTGWGRQINLVDRAAGTVTWVSKNSAGALANGNSTSPVLSADGNVLAFVSAATNLIADDTNGVADVFLHDRATGVTSRSPVTGAAALDVAISANGNVLATRFDTATDTDTIVVVDRITGLSQNVSLNADGTSPSSGYIGRPSISADGRTVAFASDSTTLGTDPQPAGADVFVGPPLPSLQ